MDIVVESVVKSLQNVTLIDQSHNHLVKLLQPLQHVEAHLVSRRIGLLSWVYPILFTPNVNKDPGQLERVVQHVVLYQRLEQSEVILLQDELGQHRLLRRRLWDLVFHEAAVVLLDDGQAVLARESLEFRLLEHEGVHVREKFLRF